MVQNQVAYVGVDRPERAAEGGFPSYKLSGTQRHAHEVWITVDKKRAFSASYCNNLIEECVISGQTGLSIWGDGPDRKRATDILTKRAVHDAGNVVSSFRTYLDLDPRIALASTDPILRSLAMLDRRLGMRTLKALEIADDEHSLVRTLYSLRMQNLE